MNTPIQLAYVPSRKKPATNKRAIFLAVVALAPLSYITIVQGGVYVPV
ncbi:hypothetical protein [Diaphorobacter caeni]|nr:hypothetical protein [Diaphorobacter caeni]MBF5007628.1 hypothetical protein [Diaphorobacter caeni]